MLNSFIKPFERYLPENNRLERIWKLAQVDFKKRYYNDKLGLFWALLNPILQICVYWYIFGHVFKLDKIDNYGIFLFAGIILWFAFSEASHKGLSIIKSKRYLLENIQFNKLDLFFAQVLSVFLGVGFNLVAFLGLCLVFGYRFDLSILLLPIILFNVALISLGVSMILATIQIFFKDIIHAWSIIMLLGFWTSGTLLQGEKLIASFPPIQYIHPFVGIIINMRAITMEIGEWNNKLMLVDLLWGLGLFLIGRYLFQKFSSKALELI